MGVVEELGRLGGVSTRAVLVARTSRRDLDRALRSGDVVASARGRYALASVDASVGRAHALGGVLSHESAALWHGWAVKEVPSLVHVTVPKKRKVPASARSGVHLHRRDLVPEEVVMGIATAPETTLEQCLRWLAPDAALAVADSALRAGVAPQTLARLRAGRGPGSVQLRSVAARARAEAANPFESVLRAIAHRVPGLDVTPQLTVDSLGCRARPDLVDERLGIVIEADSFEWHGNRAALRRDSRRYDLLVAAGWVVLRFAWEDVMHDQAFVLRVLTAVVAGRTQARVCSCRAA